MLADSRTRIDGIGQFFEEGDDKKAEFPAQVMTSGSIPS
jgi:hypothetical protein